MKTLKRLCVLLIIAAVTTSCEKEAGPAGPAGTNGTNGNANVTVYGFGEHTFSSLDPGTQYTLPISGGMADSSLILPYYHVSDYWYQMGEIGYGANFASRYFIEPFPTVTYLRVDIKNVDGTNYTGSDFTWDSIRVFVIPANIFRSAKLDNVDFKNQSEVSAYFNAR
ncbi:MAG TPA: hypothetical protein PKN48_11090 [Bacteroidales bacterium]|nr:hypothetical protein [Bacteroidales bacterium]